MRVPNPDKITPLRDWEAIRRLFTKGETFREIGKKHGVPFSTIKKKADKERWERPGQTKLLPTTISPVGKLPEVITDKDDLAHQALALRGYETVLNAMVRAADNLGHFADPKVGKEIALAIQTAETNINRIKGVIDRSATGEGSGLRAMVVVLPMPAESIESWANKARMINPEPMTIEASDE